MNIRFYVDPTGTAYAHAFSPYSEKDTKYQEFHKWHKDRNANSIMYEIEVPDTKLFYAVTSDAIRGPSKVETR